jgi:hypothetical protein
MLPIGPESGPSRWGGRGFDGPSAQIEARYVMAQWFERLAVELLGGHTRQTRDSSPAPRWVRAVLGW